MDEAAIQQQQEIYKVHGVDEDAPALNPAQKRKEAQLDDVSAAKSLSYSCYISTADALPAGQQDQERQNQHLDPCRSQCQTECYCCCQATAPEHCCIRDRPAAGC